MTGAAEGNSRIFGTIAVFVHRGRVPDVHITSIKPVVRPEHPTVVEEQQSTGKIYFPEALDKGEGFVKDKLVLSGVGDTASRQSLVEDQDLQASR